MFRLASSTRSLTDSLSTICRRLNTLSIGSTPPAVNPIVFAVQQASNPNANNRTSTYKCPEKARGFGGTVGDKNSEKSPIFDFLKSDFAVCGSVTNTPALIPEIIKRIENEAIITSIMYEQNKHRSYELPMHKSGEGVEKKADYLKHYHPNRFTHLTWVRHRKMKKHQRLKWRKKNLAMIKRRLLERNIQKEKVFRAELLNQIREAENFDPKVYVENILRTIDNVPKPETPEEKYERIRELRIKNRSQVTLVRPKWEDD